MKKKDPRIDAYIEKAPSFARPILKKVRSLVHSSCPSIEETIKWGMPSFEHKGIMLGIAFFKNHCAVGFHKASLLSDPDKILTLGENAGMGSFGKIHSMEELPDDEILSRYIREAWELNENGTKKPVALKKTARTIPEPPYFKTILKENKSASETWQKLPPSHKREYLEWITEAKQEATRERRLKQSMVWLSEGKSRNWKYEKKK